MKKLTPLIVIFIFFQLFAIHNNCFSQEIEQYKNLFITGTIFGDETEKPLPFVNVLRTSIGKGTITDTLGFFHISFIDGDLLKVSYLGYMTEYIKLIDSVLMKKSYHLEIRLKKKYYLLRQVDIFEMRWIEFEKRVKELELPEKRIKEQADKWIKEALSPEFISGLSAQNPGIKIPLISKYDKRRIAALKIEKQLADRRRAVKKMYYLAGRYTKYRGELLDHFIKYCNFPTNYILNQNDYDVTMRIKRYYHAFEEKYSD